MERTRALEWKQDKKYLDYIDSEKCFLSERQEGEEKAIMKNLRLKKVSIKDLDQIRALYWRLLDSSPKYGQILQWKKNIYPNDDDWNSYIVKGEMYLILKDTDVIGAVAVTNAQSKEYRKIHWKVKADDQDAAVVHLLMILPEYQGDGAATVALDEIIKLAADKRKRQCGWTRSELMCQHRNCMKNTALLIAEQHRSTMKVPEKQNSYFTNMYWWSSSYI